MHDSNNIPTHREYYWFLQAAQAGNNFMGIIDVLFLIIKTTMHINSRRVSPACAKKMI